MNKRSQRFTAIICALLMAGALAMTGCGSSGGGNTTSTTPATGNVSYSGTTTQAALDTTSGATVSTAATASISEITATVSSFSLSPSLMKGAPGIQPIAEAASMMEAASLQAPTSSTAGTCSTSPGSMDVNVTAASGGAYDYSITFNQYCTGTATNYYTINGSYTISGTKGNYTVTMDKLTATMVYGSNTATAEYGGKITAVTSGDVTTTTINYAYNVSGTAMTAYSFKLENFVKKDTKTTTTITTEYSGRFYYGASGYVDITTPIALIGTLGTNGYVNMYTAGTIRFTGSGGNYYEITYQSDGKTTSNLNGTSTSTAPTVTSFTPTSGAVGATVTITGTNFNTTAANNTVKFNGTQATVSAASATSLTVTVPTGATTGTVTVTTAGGTATSSSSFTVTTSSTAAPTITSFTPTSGAAGAITQISITGTNFSTQQTSNTVSFNGVQATVGEASATELWVTVPATATSGPITVTVGGQTATSATSFTVGASPTYVVQGGLTWMPVTFGDTWTNANAYCTNTINGLTGWRQPTQAELTALYTSGAMVGQGWTLNWTWSSTPGNAGFHYAVGLAPGGGVNPFADTTTPIPVSCVR